LGLGLGFKWAWACSTVKAWSTDLLMDFDLVKSPSLIFFFFLLLFLSFFFLRPNPWSISLWLKSQPVVLLLALSLSLQFLFLFFFSSSLRFCVSFSLPSSISFFLRAAARVGLFLLFFPYFLPSQHGDCEMVAGFSWARVWSETAAAAEGRQSTDWEAAIDRNWPMRAWDWTGHSRL
jgi:hypothetical protein